MENKSNLLTITFDRVRSRQELQQILALQKANLPQYISDQEQKEQGFVTVEHNLELLSDMYHAAPQIIAKDNNKVIGYALVMPRSFGNKIPVLIPMFNKLGTLSYQNKVLNDYTYFIMGQVCIDKNYRGQGIFDGLYQEQKRQLSGDYHFVITEVATRNARSIRAHERVGFKTIHTYSVSGGEEWAIILWDWK